MAELMGLIIEADYAYRFSFNWWIIGFFVGVIFFGVYLIKRRRGK